MFLSGMQDKILNTLNFCNMDQCYMVWLNSLGSGNTQQVDDTCLQIWMGCKQKSQKSCRDQLWTYEMSFLGHAGLHTKWRHASLSLMEEKLTFFLSSEELQLLLLLPPQCVDYSNGQSECFLGVAMWPKGIHSGTRSGDVFCTGRDKRQDILRSGLSFLFWACSLWTACLCCLTVPQRPPSGVKEGAVKVVTVTVVGVVVLGDDVLQVGVLPV